MLDSMNHKENKDDGNDDRPHDDGGNAINDNNNGMENGTEESNYSNEDYIPLVESMAKYSKQREECFQHYHPSRERVLTYPTGNDSWIRTVCCVCRGRAFHRVAGPFILVNVHTIMINTLLQLNYISFTSSPSSSSNVSNNKHNDDYYEEESGGGNKQPHADWMVLIYGWILTAVSFLLVFRLNRAGTRYWLARQCWGIIIARCRTLTSGILVHGGGISSKNSRSHGGDAAFARDNAIRWIITLVVTIMTYLREDDKKNSTNNKAVIPSCSLDGILTKIRYSSCSRPTTSDDPNELNDCGRRRNCQDDIGDDDDEEVEIRQLQAVSHPPIYASDRARHYLKELFLPANNNSSSSYSYYHVNQFQYLESQLDTICDQLGAMERIKYTPLPIAHVSHLRTYLLLHLLLFPYVFCSSSSTAASGSSIDNVSYTDWLFIPITCIIISFAFLGIEAASSEVESPFHQNHINNLHMDSFVVTIMRNVQQQLTTYNSK